VREPERVRGKRVLVIEDGPTLTHGEMRYGAGLVAARQLGAAEIVDPRPYARGSIRGVFERYPHLTQVLPAMGYGEKQIAELSETIAAVPCDSVLIATPIDLGHVLKLDKPSTRVTYDLDELDREVLPREIAAGIERRRMQTDPHPEVSHGKH
jgi:predicted GTPase